MPAVGPDTYMICVRKSTTFPIVGLYGGRKAQRARSNRLVGSDRRILRGHSADPVSIGGVDAFPTLEGTHV